MLTIISATGRTQGNSKKIARHYFQSLSDAGVNCRMLALDEFPYDQWSRTLPEIQAEYLIPASAFLIVMPEYNGSYPGILKLLIDESDIGKCWHHKKVILAGVSTGRAGNLRGMEHLTGALLHMKMFIHPNRLPISLVDRHLDEYGQITDPVTLNAIADQVRQLMAFIG
jgi:NAD(P)H-dependent FMN reductase